MPKPYVITLEIEEIALGLVMRKLHALPGVVAIHFDFDKKPSAQSNGAHHGAKRRGRPPKNEENGSRQDKARPNFSGTGQEAILKILRGGKTRSVAELRDAFRALGRSPASINSLLFFLQKDKKLFRVGQGLYSTRKKASAKKEAPAQ